MISEDDLKVVSLNQADRHHSYDLVQKLTFLVIGAEFIFCGYILLNVEKLSGVRHSSTLFLVSGIAALLGILWRFCYNQTYQETHMESEIGFILFGMAFKNHRIGHISSSQPYSSFGLSGRATIM